MLEKYLMSSLFQHDNPTGFGKEVFALLMPIDLTQVAYQKIAQQFLDHQSHSSQFDTKQFIQTLPAELQSVCNELCLYDANDFGQEPINILRLVLEIKKMSLKKKITALSQTTDLSPENEAELSAYSKQLNEVEKKLAAV